MQVASIPIKEISEEKFNLGRVRTVSGKFIYVDWTARIETAYYASNLN
jgi:hypothetical protein